MLTHTSLRYNPSLDQLVEALQVNIMANGILAPLPVHMNTYVLRLIEGYSNCQEDLRAKNAALEEVKRMREAAFEDFTVLAEEFRNREGQYKSEIRRLEVLLAQKNGLETVTLARTNSTLDRSQPDAKKFVSRLQERRNEAAARDAEARAAASQPTFSFLQGQSLSTDAEIMRVLDQGRGVEGIGIGDGKTFASEYPFSALCCLDTTHCRSHNWDGADHLQNTYRISSTTNQT